MGTRRPWGIYCALVVFAVGCGHAAPAPTSTSSAPEPRAPAPDVDHDGVVGASDRCPGEPEDIDGFEDEDGCPESDNDRDGVADVDDLCPNEPAFQSAPREPPPDYPLGCPTIEVLAYRDGPPGDLDNDGYPDEEDRCPVHPETFPSQLDGGCTDDGDGCPDGTAVLLIGCEVEILEVIHFDSRSAAIEQSHRELIAALVQVMDENRRLHLEIEGHVDDTEPEALGEQRAAAVSGALVQGGVDPARLTQRNYGNLRQLRPARGLRGRARREARAANRRVSFDVTQRPRLPGRPPPERPGPGPSPDGFRKPM